MDMLFGGRGERNNQLVPYGENLIVEAQPGFASGRIRQRRIRWSIYRYRQAHPKILAPAVSANNLWGQQPGSHR